MHTILSPLTTFGGKFLLYTYLVGERYFYRCKSKLYYTSQLTAVQDAVVLELTT